MGTLVVARVTFAGSANAGTLVVARVAFTFTGSTNAGTTILFAYPTIGTAPVPTGVARASKLALESSHARGAGVGSQYRTDGTTLV